MSALEELKRDLIHTHMLGAAGAGGIDFSELFSDSLDEIPLAHLFQQDHTLPPDALSQTISRFSAGGNSNSALLVSGRTSVFAVPLIKGMRVTSISFHSATTALGAGTFQKFGISDINGNLVASTNNDGATAWAADSIKKLNLTAPYDVPRSGMYYLAILIVATTVPTLRAVAVNNYGGVPSPSDRVFKPSGFTAGGQVDLTNPLVVTAASNSGVPYAYCS